MKITKETLSKEITKLDSKIATETEQLKSYAQMMLDRASDPAAMVGYGFSRCIASIETTVKEYIARREAFHYILNNLEN